MSSLRKKLVSKVRGNVLEPCAGTGRNLKYYDLGALKSLTLTDQSKEMLQIAFTKLSKLTSDSKLAESKDAPSSTDQSIATKPSVSMLLNNSSKLNFNDSSFDCIVQSFGICSMNGTPHHNL